MKNRKIDLEIELRGKTSRRRNNKDLIKRKIIRKRLMIKIIKIIKNIKVRKVIKSNKVLKNQDKNLKK